MSSHSTIPPKVCPTCGTSFLADRYHPRQVFCSRACRLTAERTPGSPFRRPGEYHTCKACGTPFFVLLTRLKNPGSTNEYCSHRCKGQRIRETQRGRVRSAATRAKLSQSKRGVPNLARRKPPVLLTCLQCGQTSERSGPSRFHAKRARFCSTACWYAYWREHPDIHPLFRGGRFPYYGPNWPDQAREARRRDGYTCRDCGKHQTRPRLDVHHVVPRSAFHGDHRAANALDNLITLCKSCHTKRTHTESALRGR